MRNNRLLFHAISTTVMLSLAPAARCGDLFGCYVWRLSFSGADPMVWTSAPATGPVNVYLWFWSNVGGMSAAEFAVQADGFEVLGFTPMNGFLNVGGSTELLLAAGGCPLGPNVAGIFSLYAPTNAGGTMCIAPSAVHGINVTVDCTAVPMMWPNTYSGVSSSTAKPCDVWVSCDVAVEGSTWGSIKSLYR